MADRLPWKQTWEWGGADFTHREGLNYARIRKTHYTDPDKTWEWGCVRVVRSRRNGLGRDQAGGHRQGYRGLVEIKGRGGTGPSIISASIWN